MSPEKAPTPTTTPQVLEAIVAMYRKEIDECALDAMIYGQGCIQIGDSGCRIIGNTIWRTPPAPGAWDILCG